MSCLAVYSCNDVDRYLGKNEPPKEITYSYSCLDSAIGGRAMNKRITKASDILRDLAVPDKEITDSVQTAYGKLFHEDMLQQGGFKLVNDKSINQKLNTVLNNLLAKRQKPSSIKYMIYELDDTTINAFTFGGRIYITKAMLQKCQGKDALLYAIVGHEIGHSEVGHIKATIKELVLANDIFGPGAGGTVFELKKLLTASFNQKNELEADYYGINLTNELGYDVCTAVAFWKEMASQENPYSQVEDFFRTHPFSNLRSECLSNHIRTNFGKNCGVVSAADSHPEIVKR
ncbi:M48 family metallopeptidase [Flavisolibacter tropicus]|nr:M48 family metallopeptidase [Flavisolibacter tropicus]